MKKYLASLLIWLCSRDAANKELNDVIEVSSPYYDMAETNNILINLKT